MENIDFSQIYLSRSQFKIVKKLVLSKRHFVFVTIKNRFDVKRLEKYRLCTVLKIDAGLPSPPKNCHPPVRVAECNDITENYYYYYQWKLSSKWFVIVSAIIGAIVGAVVSYLMPLIF